MLTRKEAKRARGVESQIFALCQFNFTREIFQWGRDNIIYYSGWLAAMYTYIRVYIATIDRYRYPANKSSWRDTWMRSFRGFQTSPPSGILSLSCLLARLIASTIYETALGTTQLRSIGFLLPLSLALLFAPSPSSSPICLRGNTSKIYIYKIFFLYIPLVLLTLRVRKLINHPPIHQLSLSSCLPRQCFLRSLLVHLAPHSLYWI